MPSLKDMRARMNSVRQTRKITSAMKLVAASKLRRAQEYAEASRPFAERMSAMLQNLAAGVAGQPGAPPLLAGTGKDDVHLQKTIDRLEEYQHRADFGTCAVDWPLLEEWDEELVKGFDAKTA